MPTPLYDVRSLYTIMNLIDIFEQAQLTTLRERKVIPDFQPGDTLKVSERIVEGANERTQVFEGLCIARTKRSLDSSFVVRRISGHEGVEKRFMLYSPRVVGIEVMRHGKVRRAKLYYMRRLFGKAARIPERVTGIYAKHKVKQRAIATAASMPDASV